jgi:pyruvate,water dikinase
MIKYIKKFSEIGIKDIPLVGGKNASLGEMFNHLKSNGIDIPDGFATTTFAYWEFLEYNKIKEGITKLLNELDTVNFYNLALIGSQIRMLILAGHFNDRFISFVSDAYNDLSATYAMEIQLAVRSSATAEDLPTASFAGQQESFLNIEGVDELLIACKKCYASLFTDRAIKYRFDHGFDHMKVALSIGVQKMVRSDLASSGVVFTLEPETGFKDVIYITGAWGLGENVVQGVVNTDEVYVYKPNLYTSKTPILSKKLGEKELTMVYTNTEDNHLKTINIKTSLANQQTFILSDEEFIFLAQQCLIIEQHYGNAMDIEWAKDGLDGKIYILQARPETIHSAHPEKKTQITEYNVTHKTKVITKGVAVGSCITKGIARILNSPAEADKLKFGEVLVTGITNPDWDPIMKKAAAIITEKGGRTSHAAIVARELGAVAIVGTGNATTAIKDGDLVTVSCVEGKIGYVYQGEASWTSSVIDLVGLTMPHTAVKLILADPDKAFIHAMLPNNGVGLMRLEFIINNSIKIHPMALVNYNKLQDPILKQKIDALTYNHLDKKQFFIEKLSQAVGTIAAAFFPKEVIVRMSDFKTNEYANLIGGEAYEPKEENPMLGFRGASRYYNDSYKPGFQLECEAMKVVRNKMGFTNVKLMIPFCRTLNEGRKVIELMDSFGLKQGVNELEIYMMTEIPSNVLLADQFAAIFDGFSIGSNDLTQLTLGIDRDSNLISNIFDENDESSKIMIEMAVRKAHLNGKKIGICGQGPSDSPILATFLVNLGIDSISFNPDALVSGIVNVLKAEQQAEVVV